MVLKLMVKESADNILHLANELSTNYRSVTS